MSKNRMMLLAPLVLLAACAGQPASKEAKAGDEDPHCLKETGTKIEREGCAGHGRSVSREELERSGEAQTGDALRRTIP